MMSQVLGFPAFFIAISLTLLLWVLAALHLYWGRGGLWPGEDETSLARMVVGAPDIRRMPSSVACYRVAMFLFLVGQWPLMMTGRLPLFFPASLLVLGAYIIAAVFLARGVAAYLPQFRRYFPEEPFATLDRRRYGPLCLLIGGGFTFLLSLGWIAP